MIYLSYLIQQRRFLYNSTEESSLQWYVPITYTTYDKKDVKNTKPKTWLKPKEVQKLDEQLADRKGWIIGNIQSAGKYKNSRVHLEYKSWLSGYYRVNYDDTLWNALDQALMSDDFDGIDPLNRAQLIDDAMNLARAGIIPYSRPLSLINYLNQETDYYPWKAAFSGFNFLLQRIDDGVVKDYLKVIVSTTPNLQ